VRGAHRAPGASEDRAQTGASQEEHPRNREENAEDRCTARAEPEADKVSEALAEQAAVAGAETEHQAREREAEPEPERAHVDEGAPRDDQRTERDQHERGQVGGCADPSMDEVRDGAAVEAEPEDRGQEDAKPGQAEAHQLGMVVSVSPLRLCAALLHARGRFRGRLMDPPFTRHARHFAPGGSPPP